MGRAIVGADVKDEIMQRIAEGEVTADLAREYGLKAHIVYNWIHVNRNKGKTRSPSPRSAPVTLDDQIDSLTSDYVGKLKILLLKQVSLNLRGMKL